MTLDPTSRKAHLNDVQALLAYFEHLSPATISRFGPHPFDEHTIHQVCSGSWNNAQAYVSLIQSEIVAYAVVKSGLLDFEIPRLSQYQLPLDAHHDYTLAPSVGDKYQGQGIGSHLMKFIIQELKKVNASKIVLWGGVQSSNRQAIRYYEKFGFQELGRFEHHGTNLDMVLYL